MIEYDWSGKAMQVNVKIISEQLLRYRNDLDENFNNLKYKCKQILLAMPTWHFRFV